MSDTSQGPGWWLASDGKWYAPEQVPAPDPPPQPVAPPPVATPPVAPPPATPPPVAPPPVAGPSPAPAKKGNNGCLKAIVIVAVIVFVLGIATVAILAFVVNKAVDSVSDDAKAEQKVENRTGISSNPLGFNAKHPPQDDLDVSSVQCSTDSYGNLQATGTLTNHSSKLSTYTITVTFQQDGSTVASGFDGLPSVDAGQSATWTANTGATVSGDVSCKVTELDRFDFGVTPSTDP